MASPKPVNLITLRKRIFADTSAADGPAAHSWHIPPPQPPRHTYEQEHSSQHSPSPLPCPDAASRSHAVDEPVNEDEGELWDEKLWFSSDKGRRKPSNSLNGLRWEDLSD